MPSRTVPMCSNKLDSSHMTQFDSPFRRSAIAVAAATAPTPAEPSAHSHNVVPTVESTSTMSRVWCTMSNAVMKRHC